MFLNGLFARRKAERDLERRLDVLRGELRTAREAHDTSWLRAIRDRAAALDLTEDDAALEVEMADGLLEVAALSEAATRGEPLPVVDTNHRAANGEVCHFLAPASRPDASEDGGGKLLFTARRLVYLGAAPLNVSWAHVAEVRDRERDLEIRLRPERVVVIRCNSYVDTLRGAWMAGRLMGR
jgi:hypothetical protein